MRIFLKLISFLSLRLCIPHLFGSYSSTLPTPFSSSHDFVARFLFVTPSLFIHSFLSLSLRLSARCLLVLFTDLFLWYSSPFSSFLLPLHPFPVPLLFVKPSLFIRSYISLLLRVHDSCYRFLAFPSFSRYLLLVCLLRSYLQPGATAEERQDGGAEGGKVGREEREYRKRGKREKGEVEWRVGKKKGGRGP